MDGEIWVESQEGRGSQFHFTIKTAHAAKPPMPAHVPEILGVSALIVEDHVSGCRILREVLSRWGMRAVASPNVQHAFAALREAKEEGSPFSIVLIDVLLPDTEGFALVEKINRNPSLAAASIMMFTPGHKLVDAARCRDLGVAAYITKPIRLRELREALRLALARANRVGQPDFQIVARDEAFLKRRTVRALRILLVEDNSINQRLTLRLLEKRGHHLTSANDGMEALEALDRAVFDLVLMDIQMPRMDGFQVTAIVREREKIAGRRLPIYAMTAHALAGDEERCLAAGMDGYIPKPVSPKQLITLSKVSSPPSLPHWRDFES
jgi:two-component system sensor histidine kinase/response regulator